MAKAPAQTISDTESYCLQAAVTDPVMDQSKNKPQDLKDPLKKSCDRIVDLQGGNMTFITNRRIREEMNNALDIATHVAGADPIEGKVGDVRLKEIAMSQFDAARAKLQNIQEGLAQYEEGKVDLKVFDPGEVIQNYYTGVQYQNAYCGTLDDIQSADYDQDLCFKMGEENPIFEKADRVNEKVNDMTFVPQILHPYPVEVTVGYSPVGQIRTLTGYEDYSNPVQSKSVRFMYRMDKHYSQAPTFLSEGALLFSATLTEIDINNVDSADKEAFQSTGLEANIATQTLEAGYRQYLGRHFYLQAHGGLGHIGADTDFRRVVIPQPDFDAVLLQGGSDLGVIVSPTKSGLVAFDVQASLGALRSITASHDPIVGYHAGVNVSLLLNVQDIIGMK